MACEILVLQPGVEPIPLALEAWSFNHLDHLPRKPLEIFFSALLIEPLLDWVEFENLARGREVLRG